MPTWGSRAVRNLVKPTAMQYGSMRTIWSSKMSPFDPIAILDEIQRLVPGYDVSQINLLSGN